MAQQVITLVTGANKGIGYEIVRGLAARHKDDMIIYLGARKPDLGEEAVKKIDAPNVRFLAVDLDDASVISKAAETISSNHGRLDVLVNNAGFAFKNAATEPTNVQARRTMEVNFFGTRRVTEAFLPLLRASANPRIVNVTSQSGLIKNVTNEATAKRIMSDSLTMEELEGIVKEYLAAADSGDLEKQGWPRTTYSMSKIVENAYTRLLARQNPKMEVVAMCPGWCRTDMAGDKAPRSAEEGAQTAIRLADGALKAQSGRFYTDDKEISF